MTPDTVSFGEIVPCDAVVVVTEGAGVAAGFALPDREHPAKTTRSRGTIGVHGGRFTLPYVSRKRRPTKQALSQAVPRSAARHRLARRDKLVA
jgi:hypothetical protein